MTPSQLIKEAREKFENKLAIRARFNPKEPIYGEENRRDLQNLKSHLLSSHLALLESVREMVEKLPKKTYRIHDWTSGERELRTEDWIKLSDLSTSLQKEIDEVKQLNNK